MANKLITTKQRLAFSGSAGFKSASIHEDSGKLILGTSGSDAWELDTSGQLKALKSTAYSALHMNNNTIVGVNNIQISDYGLYEGLDWRHGGTRKGWIGYRHTTNGDAWNAITFGSVDSHPFEFTNGDLLRILHEN